MSENERLRRQKYKRNRKRLSIIQLVAIILLSVMALSSFLLYYRMDRVQAIEYTETGKVDYLVQYKDNQFFPDEWIEKDQSYIASLIQGMTAEFEYNLDTSSGEMKFNYQYVVNAKLLIASKEKGTPYYTFEEQLSTQKSGVVKNQQNLIVKESVNIDYIKYNKIANNFVDTYGLDSAASCTLIVTFDVVSNCANNGFENVNQLNYSTSLNVPLAVDSVNIHRSSNVAEGEVGILNYVGVANRDLIFTLGVTFASLALLFTLLLFGFLVITRNEDITYSAKVRKIVRSYGSFIQKMYGEFDCDGYQLLHIKSFVEMLGIRDTIQSPILMSENKDETMTRFYIPTSTKLLYMFEIKVDNYDLLYGISDSDDDTNDDPDEVDDGSDNDGDNGSDNDLDNGFDNDGDNGSNNDGNNGSDNDEDNGSDNDIANSDDAEVPVEEAPAHEGMTKEEITETILNHLVEQPSSSDDEVLAYIDTQGNVVKITCTRSFTANLIQADPKVRDYYNKIKNHILAYKDVKARMSWRNESYNKGRLNLFKIKLRGKTIYLYCALDPEKYEKNTYFHETATAKKYAKVPMMVKIKSDRGLKRAKELVDDVMKNFSILHDPKVTEHDFVVGYPYDTTKNLVKRGLIKLRYPGAILAEVQPHHEHEKTLEVIREDVVEEIVLFNADNVDQAEIDEIVETPSPELEAIDYVDDIPEEELSFVETKDHPGAEVIGVVWPERPTRNKIYRYNPDGEEVSVGDIVIVPTRDVSSNKDVIRKAAVAHANHKIPLEDIKHPLKKIVGVIRQKLLDED